MGFAFETIVEVRMAPSRQCAETGDEVRRSEEWPPDLVLPDVNALVLARCLQRPGAPPDDDMSKREGVSTVGQRGQSCQRSTKQRAVRFENAVDNRCVSPPEQCAYQRQTDQCCRASPEISQKTDHRFK